MPIYITNFASCKTTGYRGIGRIFSIMVHTPHWAVVQGVVGDLVPDERDLWSMKRDELSMEEYRSRFLENLSKRKDRLFPGELTVQSLQPLITFKVKDEDTLCCACSRAKAEDGECHRVWVAETLVQLGWGVVLDGKQL